MRWITMVCLLAALAGCRPPRRPPVETAPPTPAVRSDAPAAAPARTEAPPARVGPSTPAPEAVAQTPAPEPRDASSRIEEVNGLLRDVYFDYDRDALTPQALGALAENAQLLKLLLAEFPGLAVVVEGHCDERGSAEYNLALGDRRATRAREHLESLGVAAASLRGISYGKEKPACEEASEACHSRNRRAHFAVSRPF